MDHALSGTQLLLAPITPGFASDVHGVNLADRLSDSAVAVLGRALTERKLLVFRNQAGVSSDQLIRFAANFGELQINPPAARLTNKFIRASDEENRLLYFTKDMAPPVPGIGPDNVWHSDASHRTEPPSFGLLRPVTLPPVGGDTMFADMAAAYRGLPEGLKALCSGLRAVHDIALTVRGATAERIRALYESLPPIEQPVIRTHPVSGEKIIYVNPWWTSHIVGWPREDSDELLAMLFRRANIPEYQCRIRWTPDMVVFFDNRSLLHYAVADYGNHPRVMERLSLLGERPF